MVRVSGRRGYPIVSPFHFLTYWGAGGLAELLSGVTVRRLLPCVRPGRAARRRQAILRTDGPMLPEGDRAIQGREGLGRSREDLWKPEERKCDPG